MLVNIFVPREQKNVYAIKEFEKVFYLKAKEFKRILSVLDAENTCKRSLKSYPTNIGASTQKFYIIFWLILILVRLFFQGLAKKLFCGRFSQR